MTVLATRGERGRGRRGLTREQAAGVLEEILSGAVPEVETAALLTVLATRGEQAPELAGFVDVMRAARHSAAATDAERDELVDVVGTGGGGPLTFNISCGAALVAAAAGAKVAKHGNRAVTSLCGAADVLEALGVPIDAGPGAGRRVPARDGLRLPLRAALSPGHEGRGAAAPRAGLPHHLQSLRPADQSRRRAHAGHRRARAQPRAAGGPHAGGAGSQARFRRAWDRWHRRADHHRRVGCGAHRGDRRPAAVRR